MKKSKSRTKVIVGIALGGPYCGTEFRSVLEGVFMPSGAYSITDQQDRKGRTVYKWHPGNFELTPA